MEFDRVENARNRVFEQDLAIGKNLPNAMSTDSEHIYRRSGMHQIQDIILTGYVRPKEKVQGGHKLEVFWTHGGDKLFYYSGEPIIEVPASLLQDGQIGAVSIDDLSAIYLFSETENKYINRLDYIKELYRNVDLEEDINLNM